MLSEAEARSTLYAPCPECHAERSRSMVYLLFVELEVVVSFLLELLEEDSDFVAFVLVLAGAALLVVDLEGVDALFVDLEGADALVVDLEGAEAFVGVDSLDLLTVPLLLAAAG